MLRMDFTSQDYLRDLATGLTKLRAAGPVVEVHFPIVGKTWITTTNDLAGRVLKDSETFTMRKNGRVAGLRWWMPGWLRTLAVSMLTMDEPDHTRLRSIVDEAFRRRAILDMEPRIFAIADELAAELFADGSPADLVERYARKLPLSIICELLGLPRADRPGSSPGRTASLAHRHGQLPSHDCRHWTDETLPGGALAGRPRHRRRRFDRRIGSRREGTRTHQQPGDGGDGFSAARCRIRNHDAFDQRISLRTYQGLPLYAIGSRRIGAARTWRLRSSCASSHPSSSPSLVSSGKILSSAGFG